MGRPPRLARATYLCVALGACTKPESGVGNGPTGDGNPPATTSIGSTADGPPGLDDTGQGPPPVAKSFFIAESMDFTGNGCENDDVNDVTSSLRNKLENDGWSGTRVTDSQTTPADFVDPAVQPFGMDLSAADNAALAVYAGHGFMDTLAWGVVDDTPGIPAVTKCNAFFSSDIRLGSLSGGWAKAVALLTSCTGRLACYESSLATNDATQVFAFNNSPIIWGNAAKRFYRKSRRMPNRDAWIKAMDNRPGLGRNSPVVYTRGTSENDVLGTHESAQISDIEEMPRNQGTTWYAYTWIDHGLEGSCTPLPGGCIGVDD